MSVDNWQFIIGMLALFDTMWLTIRAVKTKDAGIVSAILPRLYFGTLMVFESFITRTTMEPTRTLQYIGLVLLFLTANINHIANAFGRNQ